jgi:hypothetical protein
LGAPRSSPLHVDDLAADRGNSFLSLWLPAFSFGSIWLFSSTRLEPLVILSPEMPLLDVYTNAIHRPSQLLLTRSRVNAFSLNITGRPSPLDLDQKLPRAVDAEEKCRSND